MRIGFDFMDLEAFLAVKDTGSFQVAAERMNLSQSSITRRIQKLETALGTALFERTTRDVRPTLAAKGFQARAESILQEAQEATRSMRDETAAYHFQRLQTVSLATIPTIVPALVAPAIKAFRAAGHSARIRLMDLAANEVAEAVSQGEADFGICSLPMLEPTTQFEAVFNEPIGLALPEAHQLAQRATLSWRLIQSETLILPARGTGNRLLIDESLAKTNRLLRWTYEVGRSTTALELVVSGLGLALLPRSAVSGHAGAGMCWRPVSDLNAERPIGVLSRLGRVDTQAAIAFKQALLHVLEDIRSR